MSALRNSVLFCSQSYQSQFAPGTLIRKIWRINGSHRNELWRCSEKIIQLGDRRQFCICRTLPKHPNLQSPGARSPLLSPSPRHHDPGFLRCLLAQNIATRVVFFYDTNWSASQKILKEITKETDVSWIWMQKQSTENVLVWSKFKIWRNILKGSGEGFSGGEQLILSFNSRDSFPGRSF